MATAVLPGDEKMVQLRGVDKRIPFIISIKAAKQSGAIKLMLEELGDMEQGDWIPLPSVAPIILGYMTEWLQHHKDDSPRPSTIPRGPPSLPGPGKRDGVPLSDWDRDFFSSVDPDCLSPLMSAAYYLEIDFLVEQTAQAIADAYFRRYSAQQIERIFEVARESLTKAEESDD